MTSPASGASTSAPAASTPTSTPSSAPSAASTADTSVGTASPSPSAAVSDTSDRPDAPAGGTQSASAEEQAREAIRKHKLKVNGKELELDEAEVIRRAQLASAADEKFREASELRKQAETFFETLLSDPKSVLMHPEIAKRINFREIAEEYLGAELRREMMDPVERELQELREFKRAQEEAAQQQQQEQMTRAQQEEMARLQQRATEEYDRSITEALRGSDLAKTPQAVKRVVSLLHSAIQKGYELDPATAVDLVREEYQADLQSMAGSLDGESLVRFLGDDIIKKLRKFDLERIKSQIEANQPATQAEQILAPQARQQPSNSPGLRPNAWMENLMKKAGL